MHKNANKLSRTLSLVLRHDPASIGLQLDEGGWAKVDELLACLQKNKKQIDAQLLAEIVAMNDAKRFEYSEDGESIRAIQGHSIPVVFKMEEKTPPKVLYHGTSLRWMDSIVRKGLIKMERSHVHLVADPRHAHNPEERVGNSIILEVLSEAMHRHGHKFFLTENGIWLTDEVPPDYLSQKFAF